MVINYALWDYFVEIMKTTSFKKTLLATLSEILTSVKCMLKLHISFLKNIKEFRKMKTDARAKSIMNLMRTSDPKVILQEIETK